MSGGRSLDAFDTTIVCIETDTRVEGWGEVTPLGANYLPSYAEGARTGIREIAPALIGADPTQLADLDLRMHGVLRGHPYAKSAIDIACWDILGKVSGLPASTLLGGQFGEKVKLYRSITHGTPNEMARWIREFKKQGYRHFQLKVGDDPDEDIECIRASVDALENGGSVVADANGGWSVSQAARVVRAIKGLDVYIEQPCQTYEECLSIRRRIDNPFILDESIDSLGALQRALSDGAMDCVNIKLSKLGGLTRSKLIRDICVQNGVALTIEDTACTDFTAPAVFSLALSTPEQFRLSVTLANVKIAYRTAEGAPEIANGYATPTDRPGLGVTPIPEVLGEPLFSFS